jgi:hypothetical protein
VAFRARRTRGRFCLRVVESPSGSFRGSSDGKISFQQLDTACDALRRTPLRCFGDALALAHFARAAGDTTATHDYYICDAATASIARRRDAHTCTGSYHNDADARAGTIAAARAERFADTALD